MAKAQVAGLICIAIAYKMSRNLSQEVMCVRTTVEIDRELLAEAMRLLGARTKRETIQRALEEVVREGRRQLLRRKLGNTDLALDLDELERLREEG